jgi:uncharacterized protein involved in type VI secretion and phage assembly
VAGKKWGVYTEPRIGQEEVVDFLNGDPDQPIIVGSVYIAESMPPYTLPDEKTKSSNPIHRGWRRFNEFRMRTRRAVNDFPSRRKTSTFGSERPAGMDRQRPEPDCQARQKELIERDSKAHRQAAQVRGG